jgi:hypothetical protein
MQLSWADCICEKTKKPVLILAPLATAHQTVQEAAKFGIKGAAYAGSQADASSRIAVSNYDRLDKFDPEEFGGIVLDESSILKSMDGSTRTALINAFVDTSYRLCCTATPAPNDFTELGNHSEFLGVMSFQEMLPTYFVHDGSHLAMDTGFRGWRLKRHAVGAFWRWVSSWATMLGHPRDLGFEEKGYDLPPFVKHQITVEGETSQKSGFLLTPLAESLSERLGARQQSVEVRAKAAADLVATKSDEPWIIWCGLNVEAELVTKLISNATDVRGSMKIEDKIKYLLGFCKGNPRILVTKPKIAGFGMNWQHCSNVVFLGLNDSFEQMFQAIRRCWRFGQTRPVNVFIVTSACEGNVLKNVERKERDYAKMLEQLSALTNSWLRKELTTPESRVEIDFNQEVILPPWLEKRV